MKALVLAALAFFLFAPSAGADGIVFHLVSGTRGDNGWYRSQITIQVDSGGGPCNGNQFTFRTSSDAITCNGLPLQFQIDPDPPTVTGATAARAPDQNGWYNHAVDVAFSGSDSNSGIASCTSATYSGPDSGAGAVTGTCKDVAGNVSAPFTFNLQYDSTPPSVTGATGRTADSGGWFNHAVAVTFSGADAASGVASCTGSTTYSGPDTNGTTLNGSCTDKAGNTASGSVALQYDATPPSVTGATARAADSGGWFNHAVGVSFAGSDAGSGIASCTGSTTYSGPDTKAAAVSGSCTDKAGNTTSASVALQYDATPPSVKATVARPPDDHDWYTKPVGVSFAGTDATSGIDSCSPAATYSGPDDPAGHVTGTCKDAAGNTATVTQSLRYDATAPKLADVAVSVADGSAVVSWRQPADTAQVAVTRAPGRDGASSSVVYSGRAARFKDAALRAGVDYRYTVTSTDDAGNRWSTVVKATLPALFAPRAGAVVAAGAKLAWAPVKGADYYNVQLFRNGHKVLTTWPVKAELRLVRSWTYGGKHQTLRAGRYRWYVWPGHGARAKASYGALVGSNWFVVR